MSFIADRLDQQILAIDQAATHHAILVVNKDNHIEAISWWNFIGRCIHWLSGASEEKKIQTLVQEIYLELLPVQNGLIKQINAPACHYKNELSVLIGTISTVFHTLLLPSLELAYDKGPIDDIHGILDLDN